MGKNGISSQKIMRKGFYKSKLFIFSAVSSVFLTILLVLLLIFTPGSKGVTGYRDIFSKPNLAAYGLKNYNDETRANSNVPKLSRKFQYGSQPIRGVNLGGWLVLEPFITPSMFEGFSPDIRDEWSLCAKLGKTVCQKKLAHHYDTFVTEDDLEKIASMGLDHVRIPIGYWAIDKKDDEPYIYGSLFYLLRGINWARKYGLRVMVEFHGAPGSQNGWNHSGKLGDIGFLNQTNPDNLDNIEKFRKILIDTVKFFSAKEWRNVVTLFGVLNEPAIHKTDFEYTLEFYRDIYADTRNEIKTDEPLLVFHEGFIGIDKWGGKMPKEDYNNIALDTHNYLIFDRDVVRMQRDKQADIPCSVWKPQIRKSTSEFGLTMCGEFSVATNDCGKWLNGIGMGARYDGTYELEPATPACQNCTCKGVDDYRLFTNSYKTFLNRFVENQMSAFEMGMGWFFWNFKTENGVNPHWDYFLGVDQGWIPKDARFRSYNCD